MTLGKSPRRYVGVLPNNPPNVIPAQRAPTSADTSYREGDIWIYTTVGTVWIYGEQSGWIAVGTGAVGGITTLTGTSGGAISPIAGTIIITGDLTDGVTVVGTAGTLTVNIAAASTTQRGSMETSTTAEAIAGSSAIVAVTPAALQAKIGTQTAHGVAMGSTGATAALSWSAAGTSGQPFLSGGAAADGAYGNLAVPAGGTGATTLTGLILGNGAGAMTATTYTAATSFTPAFALGTPGDEVWTYTSQVGRYTRHSAIVYFVAEIAWSNFANTTGTGTIHFNLPVASGAFVRTGHVHISGSGLDIAGETLNFPVNFVGEVGNAQSIQVLGAQEQGAVQATAALYSLDVAVMKTSGTLTISGWYFAA